MGGNPKSYQLRYSRNPQITWPIKMSLSGGITSYTLNGLESGTGYQVTLEGYDAASKGTPVTTFFVTG